MNNKKYDKYVNDDAFCNFVMQGLKDTLDCAAIEEIAEFAFGSMDDAVEAFDER